MTNYKRMNDVINNCIGNSHQDLCLPEDVKKTFNEFHNEHCGENISKNEHLIGVNNNGDIIYKKEGKDNRSVPLGWEELCKHWDKSGESLYITHNHTQLDNMGEPVLVVADGLSYKDIYNLFKQYSPKDNVGNSLDMVYPIKCMCSESPNGSRMILCRGDNFKKENFEKAMGLSEGLDE